MPRKTVCLLLALTFLLPDLPLAGGERGEAAAQPGGQWTAGRWQQESAALPPCRERLSENLRPRAKDLFEPPDSRAPVAAGLAATQGSCPPPDSAKVWAQARPRARDHARAERIAHFLALRI